MLLSDYLDIGPALDEKGVFDPVMDEDSHFFINLQRLKRTEVPEFVESYKKIHDFFRKVIKLLDKAKRNDESDLFYKQAVRTFHFSEVNGICLGYAKGTNGAGFGDKLTSQVMGTAYDIVKAGVSDPEFFELLPLFQDNVGADRLSDMIATLILDDIKTYTKRINSELGINPRRYGTLCFHGEFLVNPYKMKHDEVLLIPVDILHKLPVAESWEDIDLVVSQNNILRNEMNHEVASEWGNYTTSERKAFLKEEVFRKPDVCRRVIEGYRAEELKEFNPRDCFPYLNTKLEQEVRSVVNDWKNPGQEIDSYSGAMTILDFFKQWVESNKGWEVIRKVNSAYREKILQRIIHLAGSFFIRTNNLDMSCEPDEGRGPVDFKISRGQDMTLMEVKLSSNDQYFHGYETQIEEYGKAERTENMIYVLVDLGHPGKIKKVQDYHDRKEDEGIRTPYLFVIDATKKESASRT